MNAQKKDACRAAAESLLASLNDAVVMPDGSFHGLDEDCLALIVTQLSASEVFFVALTCRRLRDAVLGPRVRAMTGQLLVTPAGAALASPSCLEFALSAGLPTANVCSLAAAQGNLPMLQYALDRGLPCLPEAAHAATCALTNFGRFSFSLTEQHCLMIGRG
jgi:hypothetical protein